MKTSLVVLVVAGMLIALLIAVYSSEKGDSEKQEEPTFARII